MFEKEFVGKNVTVTVFAGTVSEHDNIKTLVPDTCSGTVTKILAEGDDRFLLINNVYYINFKYIQFIVIG